MTKPRKPLTSRQVARSYRASPWYWQRRVEATAEAEEALRGIAARLRQVGAIEAATYVRKALKSVQGANRHASGALSFAESIAGALDVIEGDGMELETARKRTT